MKFASSLLLSVALSGLSQGITIAQAKVAPVNTIVTIEGVRLVTDVDLVNNNTLRDAVVDDPSGGLTIFGPNVAMDVLLDGVSVGDKFTLTGVVGTFNGKFQILTPFSKSNILDLNQPVVPINTSAADFQDQSPTAELLESRLVRIFPVQFVESGTFLGLTNYTLTDGSRTVATRVSTTFQDLVNTPIPTGLVMVSGIFSQFDSTEPRDGGYQLLLRTTSDIVRIASPTGITAATGDYFEGDLSSVLSSDDSRYSLFNDIDSLGASAMIDGSLPLGATTLSMLLETSVGRLGLAEQVKFRNWGNGQWITVSGRVATPVDTEWTTTKLTNATQFQRLDGMVQALISWQPINDEDPAQDGWLHGIDLIYWLFEG